MPEFRRALSHALNRERMQRMLYFGLGTPTSGTFSPKAAGTVGPRKAPQSTNSGEPLGWSTIPRRLRQCSTPLVSLTTDGWRICLTASL